MVPVLTCAESMVEDSQKKKKKKKNESEFVFLSFQFEIVWNEHVDPSSSSSSCITFSLSLCEKTDHSFTFVSDAQVGGVASRRRRLQ